MPFEVREGTCPIGVAGNDCCVPEGVEGTLPLLLLLLLLTDNPPEVPVVPFDDDDDEVIVEEREATVETTKSCVMNWEVKDALDKALKNALRAASGSCSPVRATSENFHFNPSSKSTEIA